MHKLYLHIYVPGCTNKPNITHYSIQSKSINFHQLLNQFVDFMRSWLSRKLRGSRINLPTIRGS